MVPFPEFTVRFLHFSFLVITTSYKYYFPFLMIIFDMISQGIIPIESLLTKIALKRLSILMDHSIVPEFMAFPCESHITFLT